MKKQKIGAFIGFFAAIVFHLILCAVSDIYKQYRAVSTALITTAFATVLFYFGLCHSKGWHGLEKKTRIEWYYSSAFVFISGLTMVSDITILEIIGETFWEWTCALAAYFWYKESKSKWALFALFGFLLLSWMDIYSGI